MNEILFALSVEDVKCACACMFGYVLHTKYSAKEFRIRPYSSRLACSTFTHTHIEHIFQATLYILCYRFFSISLFLFLSGALDFRSVCRSLMYSVCACVVVLFVRLLSCTMKLFSSLFSRAAFI